MNARVRFYIIEGRPRPLQRVRFANGRAYDSQAKEKKAVRDDLLYQHGISEPKWAGPVHMMVEFYMPLCGTKARKKLLANTWHDRRPDTSNLIKFIEDAAIGALFDDDCIISMITARKKYCTEMLDPRTVFYIFPLPDAKEIMDCQMEIK